MTNHDEISLIFKEYTKGSMSERTRDALRIAIINHTLGAGERLVESNLAKRLGVSITPVRYAFTQLSKEGLIDIYPYRGTYVKALTKQFVREVCEVRSVLEKEAARTAFEHFTPEDLAMLEAQAKLLSQSIDAFRFLYEACRADTGFHDIIFERSGNETLIQFWEMLRVRMEYITSYTKMRTTPEIQKERHMLLVRDLQAGDREKFLMDVYDHCIHPNQIFFEND